MASKRRHRRLLDRAQHRARVRAGGVSTWSGTAPKNIAVVPAWFAGLDALPEARAVTHDTIIELLGASRRGPVSWRWWTGDAAVDALDTFTGTQGMGLGFQHRSDMAGYIAEIRHRLDEFGGYVIFAFAAGDPNA